MPDYRECEQTHMSSAAVHRPCLLWTRYFWCHKLREHEHQNLRFRTTPSTRYLADGATRNGTFCQRAFTKLLTSKISGPSSNTELNTVSAPKIGGSMTSIFEPSCITLVLIYSPWFMVVPGVCHVDIAYAALHSHRDVLPVYVLLLHECHALQPIGRKFSWLKN